MKHLHRLFVLMLVFIVHDWFDLFGAALSIVVPTAVKLSQNPYSYTHQKRPIGANDLMKDFPNGSLC